MLSLCGGVETGLYALQQLGILIREYHTYEILPEAIAVSQYHFPFVVHHGDLYEADFEQFKGFDLLLVGTCCQSLSRVRIESKEVNNGLDGKSGIFFKAIECLRAIQPKYFMFENVIPSSDEDLKTMTECIGVEPILIDSGKFSAQSRERYYWTNIPGVTVPEDKGVTLQSVLNDGYVPNEKAKCLCKNDSHGYYNGCFWTPIKRFHRFYYKSFGTMVFPSKEYFDNCLEVTKRILDGRKSSAKIYDDYNGHDFDEARYLWKDERARLQGVPEEYVKNISEKDAADVLGDGWTVLVIAHIFSFMKF